MNLAAQRRVGVIAALAVSIFLLSACSPVGDPGAAPSETPSPSPTEVKATPTPTPTPTPTVLTFEAGAEMDPAAWSVEWGDRFPDMEGYTLSSPDDGNGSWAYRDDTTQCDIGFYQGFGPSADMDHTKDDRTLSDAYLATFTQASSDDVAQYGFDSTVQIWDTDVVAAFRSLGWSTDDGASRVDSVRVFVADEALLYVTVTCPPESDAFVESERLAKDLFGVNMTSTDG